MQLTHRIPRKVNWRSWLGDRFGDVCKVLTGSEMSENVAAEHEA